MRSVFNAVLAAIKTAADYTAVKIAALGGAVWTGVKVTPPVMEWLIRYQPIVNDLLKHLPGGDRLMELLAQILGHWFR